MAKFEAFTVPARNCFAITPHDDNDLAAGPTRGIAFKTAGDIVGITAAGDTVTIPSGVLAVGVIHAIQFKRIKATGTLAGNIWGFV